MPRRTVVALLSISIAVAILLAGCGSGTSTPVVAQIVINPGLMSIAVSGTDGFSATAEDRRGNPIGGILFTWTSSANNIASITNGLAKGILPGTTQITAAADGVTSAPITLTVTPGFLSIGSMNTARIGPTATLLNNGMVLIAGGNNSGVEGNDLTSAELFNPATRQFSVTGSLNTQRFGATATLLNNGKVLIAGGIGTDSTDPIADAELYDPGTGTFTPTGSMNVARYEHTATLLANGKVLVASGFFTNTAELYDPVTGTFSLTGSMNELRYKDSAVLLNNGKVLIASGLGSVGFLNSAELYDPETGSFSPTGSLSVAREFFTATLLNSGMVLIAGGADPVTAAAELYNPGTGTFTLTGSMNAARFDHTATLLTNGTVLIAGGNTSGIASTASAEIYDPAAGTFSVTGGLNDLQSSQTATLLNDGTVLVAGGGPAVAEIYEPGTFMPPGLESIAVYAGKSHRLSEHVAAFHRNRHFCRWPAATRRRDLEFLRYHQRSNQQ